MIILIYWVFLLALPCSVPLFVCLDWFSHASCSKEVQMECNRVLEFYITLLRVNTTTCWVPCCLDSPLTFTFVQVTSSNLHDTLSSLRVRGLLWRLCEVVICHPRRVPRSYLWSCSTLETISFETFVFFHLYWIH